MNPNFRTATECIEALGSDIFFQDTSSWVLIALGIVVVVAIIVHLFIRGKGEPSYYLFFIVVLFLGLGASSFALTGTLPGLSSLSTTEAKFNNSVIKTWRAGCYAIDDAVAGADEPVNNTTQETVRSASNAALSDPSLRDTFVWVFYSDARRPEGYAIRDALRAANVEAHTGEDGFGAVRVPKAPGTTRLLYSSQSYEDEARILAEALKPLVNGDIILDGPYPTMTNKPLQLLMF